LLAGLALCLSRQGAQQRLVLGMPVAGQTISHETGLIGNCLRYLPLVVHVDPAQPLERFLAEVRTGVIGAIESARYPVGDLTRELPRPADPRRVPLPATCLNMSPKMDQRDLRYDALDVRYETNPRDKETFELFFNAVEGDDASVVLETQ